MRMAVIFIAIALPLLYLALRERSDQGVSDADHTEATMLRAQDQFSAGFNSKEHELQLLERDLQKNPDHVPVLLRMAQITRELGKSRQAVVYLQQAVELEPSNTDVRLELGRALWEAGDVEGALEETRRLLLEHPESADALYNLGAIHGNLGQSDLAKKYWEEAVSLDPDSESGRLAALALAQLSPQ
jgi:Flp pilus assembly protein TadD